MPAIDIAIFIGFIVSVVGIGLWKSRGEKTRSEHGAQNYFLAGRGLTWWLVGFSLIAANISTEQFVGMSGKSADWLGMAIASYEWMAAITLVVVAFLFLPKFLKSGIYTIPEFLEYRFNAFARTLMAIITLIILVGVPTATVIYSGAKVITVSFQGYSLLGLDLGDITVACWIIGSLAAIYVFAGGLKACAWADLIQGASLIVGGAIVAYLALDALAKADPDALVGTARNPDVTAEQLVDQLKNQGPIDRLYTLNQAKLPEGKMHMVRPYDDKEVPWTALVIGLWIPNFFYWGLNQYITQRTLGSKSLAEGQKGVVFAAFLKLLIPFVVVIPGILAYNLFNHDLKNAAIVKNAKTIATYAPDVYDSLSDNLKPPANEALFANDVKAIAKRLESARLRQQKKIPLFQFTEIFAKGHPQDAYIILKHNASKMHVNLPDSLVARMEDNPSILFDENTKLMGADTTGTKTHELVLRDYDAAFPVLLRNLLPAGKGLKGFILAAIWGAVVSSLASMLNSASTIASMDLYRKIRSNASQYELVTVGRICVVIFVLIAMFIAPGLDDPAWGGIFTFIQEFQGFISPGILSIFLFGVLVPRAPRSAGTVGLLLNPILYGFLMWQWQDEIAFLNRMAICFGAILVVLTFMTILWPLKKPVDLPVNESMNVESSKSAIVFGGVVVLLTIALYIIFW
ncbi:MAG: sodium/solute symporter [Pirellulales bacterium]|nr:sodium/solute symporter [Pirellulales bacterium]